MGSRAEKLLELAKQNQDVAQMNAANAQNIAEASQQRPIWQYVIAVLLLVLIVIGVYSVVSGTTKAAKKHHEKKEEKEEHATGLSGADIMHPDAFANIESNYTPEYANLDGSESD